MGPQKLFQLLPILTNSIFISRAVYAFMHKFHLDHVSELNKKKKEEEMGNDIQNCILQSGLQYGSLVSRLGLADIGKYCTFKGFKNFIYLFYFSFFL